MERGFEIKVLDHGYVRFVDSLGTDESIVEAARMSTGRGFVSWEPYKRCKKCDGLVDPGPSGEGFKWRRDLGTVPDKYHGCAHDWQDFPRGDLGILDYLYKNRHTTPFEMCELVIDVQVPMDHWRQWIRHRTANVNEYSTRYSEAIDLVAATAPDAWRTQGVTNRQGSGAFLPVDSEPRTIGTAEGRGQDGRPGGAALSARETEFHRAAREIYEERLAAGVAKEQARKDLPLSTYTAARWKCDLHNIFHFLGLRMHPHAQIEIRQYANAVAEIVKAVFPRSYALFEEYSLFGVHLSRTEALAILDVANGDYNEFLNNDTLLAKLARAKPVGE